MSGSPPVGKHILAAKISQKRSAFGNPNRAISLAGSIFGEYMPSSHGRQAVIHFYSVVFAGVRTVAFFVFWMCLVAPPAVSALPTDSTEDAKDELFLVTINSGKRLNWQVLSSNSEYSESVQEVSGFGKRGDHLIPADWLGEGSFQLGYLRGKRGSNTAVWNIRDGEGIIQAVRFGSYLDVLVSGADFNGDGIGDMAAVSRNGKASIRYSPFLINSTTSTVSFPRFFTANIRNGRGGVGYIPINGVDQLFTIVKQRIKRIARYRIRRADGTNTALTGIPRGQISSVSAIQTDSDSYGYLLVESLGGNSLRVRAFSIDGSLRYSESYIGSTVIVGKFSGGGEIGGQYGVLREGILTIVSPFDSIENTSLSLPDGVLADFVNVNQFASPADSSSSAGSSSEPVKNEGGGGNCSSFSSFGSGRLWKPEADAPDARRGKPAVLLVGGNKNGDRGSLDVFSSNGEKICNFTYKASSEPGVNNGADHYFSGWISGCAKSCSELRTLSRLAGGNGEVAVEWKGGSCLGPIDPCGRYGSL